MGELIKHGKDVEYTFTYTDKYGNSCTGSFKDYKNKKAPYYLTQYVTRTRPDEKRTGDLKYWGAIGFNCQNVDMIIHQFYQVQQIMRDKIIRRAYHFTYSPDILERQIIGNDFSLAAIIAYNQAMIFYNEGFQVVYAVHEDENKKLHFHFAINSVNYMTGKMFHYSKASDQPFLQSLFTNISYDFIARYRNMTFPFVYSTEKIPDA